MIVNSLYIWEVIALKKSVWHVGRLFRTVISMLCVLATFWLMVSCHPAKTNPDSNSDDTSSNASQTGSSGESTAPGTTTTNPDSSNSTSISSFFGGNSSGRSKNDSGSENSTETTSSTTTPVNSVKSVSDFLSPSVINNIYDSTELEEKLGAAPKTSDVDLYQIANDGGLIYNPLSKEAAENGTLDKYDNADATTGSITLNGTTITYCVPTTATAYDMIPVAYRIDTSSSASYPVHFSANAFEDSRSDGQGYYDLNQPDKVDADIEYLGYVDGTYDADKKAVLSSDFNDKQSSQYPYYNTTDLIDSGTVTSTDIVWFKFKYTNTGNTIWDSDGNGTFCFQPLLYKQNGDGSYSQVSTTENLYQRIYDYVYPGESGEFWVTFPDSYSDLSSGNYKIVLNGLVRTEVGDTGYSDTIWGGYTYTTSEFAFTVADSPAMTAPNSVNKTFVKTSPTRNGWLHYYEEFMSSYVSAKSVQDGSEEGILYVQAAPWTQKLELKVLLGNEDGISTAEVPISIETDSITVPLNENNNNYVTLADGSRSPMIAAQTLADMRSNKQRGPDASSTIINDLMDMKDAGINYLCSTIAFSYDVSPNADYSCLNFEANKFMMDTARVLGFTMEGYSSYPYNTVTAANALLNGSEKISGASTGYSGSGFAQANAVMANYTIKRYGDLLYQTNGLVPITTEDTRGWMRVDIRTRLPIGIATLVNFRNWLTGVYGNARNVNSAYGSKYSSINDIDPESESDNNEYQNLSDTYCDWSKAITDLDIYRTFERADSYVQTLQNMNANAKVTIRTEGANWLVAGINPDTTNAHFRHVYYSQRRCALIAEILQGSGAVYGHSDYVTLPYTATEVAELTAAAASQGIVEIPLAQFNRMRDIACNSKYGSLDYTVDYNTSSLTKGAYLNTCSSVFTWWKAVYENGGVPGVTWQDYLCDGFVTSTQFKEMQFFAQKLNESLATEEGQAWVHSTPTSSSAWSDGTVVGAWSFDENYVRSLVENVNRDCIFND